MASWFVPKKCDKCGWEGKANFSRLNCLQKGCAGRLAMVDRKHKVQEKAGVGKQVRYCPEHGEVRVNGKRLYCKICEQRLSREPNPEVRLLADCGITPSPQSNGAAVAGTLRPVRPASVSISGVVQVKAFHDLCRIVQDCGVDQVAGWLELVGRWQAGEGGKG